MALTPFTTNDTVRGLLGVTPEELEDATLNQDFYLKSLKYELALIGLNNGALASAVVTIAAKAPNDRTALEQGLLDASDLFCPYAVSVYLESSTPLFAPKQVSDGKSSLARHADSPFKEIFKSIRSKYDTFKANLTTAWGAYSATNITGDLSVPTLFASAQPASDPVTGT